MWSKLYINWWVWIILNIYFSVCIRIPTGCTGLELNSNKNGFDCTGCSTGYTMM